jgi:hypothetical protein
MKNSRNGSRCWQRPLLEKQWKLQGLEALVASSGNDG